MAIVATKSLTPKQREAARRALGELIEKKYGTASELARQLGISQPTLSEIVSGKKGLGGKTLIGLLLIEPEVVAQFVGGKPVVVVPIRDQPDTIALARDALPSVMARLQLTREEAWERFLDLPVAAHKGSPWTLGTMIDWAIEDDSKRHAPGLERLGAQVGVSGRRGRTLEYEERQNPPPASSPTSGPPTPPRGKGRG